MEGSTTQIGFEPTPIEDLAWPEQLISDPSYLDNIETNTSKPEFALYSDYKRKPHMPEFEIAWKIYNHFDHPDRRSKAQLLSSCRSNAWFTRHKETGEVRVVSNACHLRWCPVCAEARKNYIAHSVAEFLKELKFPKLLTLTLKHADVPIAEQIDRLYDSFHQLRDRKYFKKLVTGGVWFFQIKRSRSDGLWHPHLHCAIGGKYIPHRYLRHEWKEITTDSTEVNIKPIIDIESAALEVARYAACPCQLKALNLDHAAELVECMHGRRICGTWGVGRSVSLRPPTCTDKDMWESLGSWSTVVHLRTCDDNAKAIWKAWQKNEVLAQGISTYRIDALLDDLPDFENSRSPPDEKTSLFEKPDHETLPTETVRDISAQY